MDERSGEESIARAALEQALAAARARLGEAERECEGLRAELTGKRDELRQRTSQMRRAEQLARIGYWYSDLRTGKVLWSEGMSNLLGFPADPQQRIPGEIYQYVHPEDRPAVYRAVNEALAGTGIYMAEFRARNLKGAEHHVRILGEIEFDQGRPVANFGVGQDITPIKRAEAALRESEDRCRRQAMELELIYATAPVGLCVLDARLRFTHVNERLAEINGVPVERHLGRTVREVVPWLAGKVEPPLRTVVETGKPVLDFEVTAELGQAPGERTWVSQYWPMQDDSGAVVGINAVIEEITERRRLDEARRSEREFRALAEHSIDVVSRFDRSLRRTYANQVIEKVLHRPRSEIIGRTNEQLGLPPEVAAFWNEGLQKAFATGKVQSLEGVLPDAEGGRVLDARVIPEFDEHGHVATLLAISRDITERKRAETALRESERKYRTLVENLYEGIWMIDAGGITTFVNRRMAELLGYSPEEVLGRSLFSFMGEPQAELARQNLARSAGGQHVDYDFEFQRKNGERIWTHLTTAPLFDAEGRYQGALAGVIDITGRKRAEDILYRREQEFEALAERSPDVIARVDRAGRIWYVNPAVERVSGRPRTWFLGKTPAELELPPRERALRESIVRRVFETRQEQVLEHQLRTPHGRRFFHSRLVPEFGPDGGIETVLVVDRDVTDMKQAQFALEELTLRDPLTGIANRRYLNRLIDREWRREARHSHCVAVVMADIDFFKAFNDRYGHQRGDECLRQVAAALQESLHRPTDFVVRYGGEEFAMVLLESDLTVAMRLAEAMRAAVTNRRVPHEASPVAPVITISLGVAAARANQTGFKELLKAADQALYRAKSNGRNRVEAARLPGQPA